MKCLVCGKVYTTRSSYYSHRRKRHPKLPRVEDIYRRGQKIHSGTGNKHAATDKSKLAKEGAGGKLTTNRRIGGRTGEGTKSVKSSALANNANIAAKDVVNVKTKGDTIENITIRLPGVNEGKRRKKSTKNATRNDDDDDTSKDAEKLRAVANIVENLKMSPKSKIKKSSKSKEKERGKTEVKGSLKVKLKKPKENKKAKTRKMENRLAQDSTKQKEPKQGTKRKKKKTSKEQAADVIDEIKTSPKKKKKKGTKEHESKKKSIPGVKHEAQTETPKSGSSSPEIANSATKVNRRKSSSPRKSTGPRFSPLVIPERASNPEPISGSSPGSEERALVQVAPVLSMKAYNSEGRPIHVKFVPVLAQSEDGEGSGLSTDEICASIQKQALDIAARVKDELISSGVRVSSTSTENSSDYLSKVDHQSPNSKQIDISPLLPSNRNSNITTQEIVGAVEENNNELVCAEPLDLSISSYNKNKKNNNKTKSEQNSNSDVTMDYDPENVIDITPIEYPSGRKSQNDGWVVPQRDFRKRGRPPRPMKQKVIAVGDPSRVVSSMVINVDLQQQQQSQNAPQP